MWIGSLALLLVLAILLWQGYRLRARIAHLESRAAQLQSGLDIKSSAKQAAQPQDFAHTLPDAPSVAHIMQTLQQAADKEGAQVVSLQADDHPPTESALGHLDLVLSIKAPYPAILVVLQQALDRYPGATIRQLDLAHAVAPAAVTPMAPAPLGGATALPPASETEARVLLSFWRRPLGVAQTVAAPVAFSAAGVASAASGGLPPASAGAATAAAASAPRTSSGAR